MPTLCGQWKVVKFPSVATGSGSGENGVYTHSFSRDSSTTNHDTHVTRHSMEGSAQVPELGGTARDSSLQLGAFHSNFSGRRVTPLG